VVFFERDDLHCPHTTGLSMKFKRENGRWVAESAHAKYVIEGVSTRKFMLYVTIQGYTMFHPFPSIRDAKRFAFKYDMDRERKIIMSI